MWCQNSFPPGMGEKVENLFTQNFVENTKKTLTEGDLMRYTVELQACPHLGLREADPIPGTSLYGGYHYEENLSAQEASAQAGPRLSDPHEHQERPQGHRSPPCKGPQEPDCLIPHRFWAPGAAQGMMRKKDRRHRAWRSYFIAAGGGGPAAPPCKKRNNPHSVKNCRLSSFAEKFLKELAKKTPERTFKVR